ncbi:MAG: biopolymer transporter ExbD [Planctomycetota bacterium]
MEFKRENRRRSGIELTPLIDVVFQLLVFFLLTSSFVQPSIRLDLPQGSTEDEADTSPVAVEIDSTGNISVDGRVVLRARLEDEIRRALEDGRDAVRLSGDEGMEYGLFMEALDASRRAGAAHFDLVHEGPGEAGGSQD